MNDPTVYCTECGRERNCLLHMRSEFPPDAADRWLRRTCSKRVGIKDAKACPLKYRAGVRLTCVEGQSNGTEAAPHA